MLVIALMAHQRSVQHAVEEAARASADIPSEPVREADGEAMDPGLVRLLALAEDPKADVGILDAAAHGLLVRERFEEARPLVERALVAAPGDAEASIHRAVLQGVAGDIPGARALLKRLAAGPAGWEASLFAAGFALRAGDEAAALRELRRFRSLAPPGEVTPALEAEISRLERRAPSPGPDNQLQK